MGSNESSNQQNRPMVSDSELHKSITQKIDQKKRLKLNHESNIYLKGQCLQKNYTQFQSQFQQLQLTHNMISKQFLLLFTKMNTLNIRVLSLGNNRIDCQSLHCLRQVKLKNLEYLHLDNNIISNDGCYYLTTTNFQSLLVLDLNFNNIENQGCKNLSKASFPSLTTLLICNNKFDERGLRYLGIGQWPMLAYVKAKYNGFQPDKDIEKTKFRTEVKSFRLDIH